MTCVFRAVDVTPGMCRPVRTKEPVPANAYLQALPLTRVSRSSMQSQCTQPVELGLWISYRQDKEKAGLYFPRGPLCERSSSKVLLWSRRSGGSPCGWAIDPQPDMLASAGNACCKDCCPFWLDLTFSRRRKSLTWCQCNSFLSKPAGSKILTCKQVLTKGGNFSSCDGRSLRWCIKVTSVWLISPYLVGLAFSRSFLWVQWRLQVIVALGRLSSSWPIYLASKACLSDGFCSPSVSIHCQGAAV